MLFSYVITLVCKSVFTVTIVIELEEPEELRVHVYCYKLEDFISSVQDIHVQYRQCV